MAFLLLYMILLKKTTGKTEKEPGRFRLFFQKRKLVLVAVLVPVVLILIVLILIVLILVVLILIILVLVVLIAVLHLTGISFLISGYRNSISRMLSRYTVKRIFFLDLLVERIQGGRKHRGKDKRQHHIKEPPKLQNAEKSGCGDLLDIII